MLLCPPRATLSILAGALLTGVLWAPSAAATNAYSAAVTATSGVQSYYRLGEPSGSAAADSVAPQQNGTFTSVTLGRSSLLMSDIANKSAAFNGSSSRVTVPDAPDHDFSSAVTIEAWIRPAALTGGNGVYTVAEKSSAYVLRVEGGSGDAVFRVTIGGTAYELRSPGAVAVNRIDHLVATYDGANQRLYRNGLPIARRAQTGTIANSTAVLAIGSASVGGSHFNGVIDDVSLYSSALTSAQVREHYAKGATRVGEFEQPPCSSSTPFCEFDGNSTTTNATLTSTTERAFAGTRAAKVTYDGSPGDPFARTWYDVDWASGSDVWYGAAFYVSDPAKLQWTDLIRWDNFSLYQGSGDTGGLFVENGVLKVKREDYTGANFLRLVDGGPIPAGRWFWVEVHQKLAGVDGQALTELYVDGVKRGSSTLANSRGRPVTSIRHGYVSNAAGGGASTLHLDRASISQHSLSRVGGFEQPPCSSSAPFCEFDANSSLNATLMSTTERAYTGTRAAKVTYGGAPASNVFARTSYGVGWTKDTDVWYGAAFYVPDPAKLQWTDLIRWDNSGLYPDPDAGGVLVDNGNLWVKRENMDGRSFVRLVGGGAVPARRWFWVEVRQKLSNVNGQAITELYIDGVKRGSSTLANSRGRQVTWIHYGYVYNWDGGGASTLYFDRASISDRAVGP